MNLPVHKKMLSAAAAASVLLLTAACGGGSDSPSTTSTPSGDDTSDATPANYKDGDFEGEASYPNPSGTSKVKVDLTLDANKVTAIEVTPEATNSTSKGYQTQFAGGVADQVVGKRLDDLNISKVAGSSLTSEGFNKAIDQIKADAKA